MERISCWATSIVEESPIRCLSNSEDSSSGSAKCIIFMKSIS